MYLVLASGVKNYADTIGKPTVVHDPGLSTAYENREAIFRRILHEFGTHHDP